jgi:hypothetical protein
MSTGDEEWSQDEHSEGDAMDLDEDEQPGHDASETETDSSDGGEVVMGDANCDVCRDETFVTRICRGCGRCFGDCCIGPSRALGESGGRVNASTHQIQNDPI